ncbi:hypothetical protein GQ600_8227 [Phytophthora cactorum]|nr:hypothetical protein GQ600_8227 [Phytophthora cactorum]
MAANGCSRNGLGRAVFCSLQLKTTLF